MAKPTRRFQYQKRDPGTIKTRSNQRGGDFDSIWKEGVKLFKPKEGKNTIRILPPTWNNADHYGYNIFVNYNIGVDNQSYLSLSSMKNERDPLAEARKDAEKEGNKKLADSLRPTKRVAFYVIDRNDEEEGPQLWAAPWTVDKAFCGIAVDEESGAVTMVDDPDEGCDIRFYIEGSGKNREYPAAKMKVFKPSPLSENEGEMQAWLDQVSENPIPSMLNFYDYDYIAGVFEGHVAKTGEDNETSQRSGKAPSKGKKPWDDDEEDGEKPAKAVVKAKPAGVTDDEDVDEETGEVTPKNGKNGGNGAKLAEGDDEAPTKMSVQAIRDKLRSRRPSVSDED